MAVYFLLPVKIKNWTVMLTVMRTSGSLELNVYSCLFWSINIVTQHFVLNICIHFRLHFHNPSFGLHTEEGPSSPAPPPALIPGQHQYTNPIESSGANDVSSDLTSLHNNIIRWTQSVYFISKLLIFYLLNNSEQACRNHFSISFYHTMWEIGDLSVAFLSLFTALSV